MTYPHPAVAGLLEAHFVPARLLLNRPADQPHFRANRVIWTPTLIVFDHRGVAHYQSPGYLPPELFVAMLQVGLARALTAWSRYDAAAALLEEAAAEASNAFAAEALFWLGVTRYLHTRRRAPMMEAWSRLRREHPASAWAARIPPNQEDEPESAAHRE